MLIERIRRYFNMIEITLAIAIMGVGITSLMVLMPVGLRSSQESVANNYVPIIADYFMTMIRNRVIHDRAGTAGNYTYTDLNYKSATDASQSSIVAYLTDISGMSSGSSLPMSNDMYSIDPETGEIKGGSGNNAFDLVAIDESDHALTINNVIIGDSSGNWDITKVADSPANTKFNIKAQPTNIFVNGNNNAYIVVFRSKSEDGGLEYDKVDFAAEVLLYKDQLRDTDNPTGYSLDDAARIIMHISWPIELPADKRQSRIYTWDVVKGGIE
ncbi:MAG: hypothetical protein ACI4OV_06845 [Victivallaceae bacterium]